MTPIHQWLPLLPLLLIPLILIRQFLPKKQSTHDNNRPPNHPPSPPSLPIIGNLHQLGKTPHRALHRFSKTLGPVMLLRLGCVPTLVVSSAAAAAQVLKAQDLSFCSRPTPSSLRRLSYNSLDIAFAPYGPYWREMRKIFVLQLLSPKRVRSSAPIRAQEVASLVDSVSGKRVVNLSEELLALTSGVICRVAFGRRYEGRFVEVVYEALEMLGGFAAADFFPGWRAAAAVDVLSGLRGRLERCFREFDEFYQRIIDDHLEKRRGGEEEEEEEDIIDVLVGLMRDESSEIRITPDHIKAILMNIFLAGVDTGAIITVWGMTELARKPELMKKAQEEIRRIVGKKGKVEESDLEQLPYLKMVVKETLRMHPPGVLLVPRECMNHCKINGYDVYPKTRVMVNVWAIGRDPDYWHNPNEFIPERFEDSSIDYKGQYFEYLPFGGGRRICPGIAMGVLNVELALANLLYCFDWELPEGMKVEDIDMDEEGGLTIHKKTPLRLVPVKYNF